MIFISSDTNVWIDFDVLGRLDLPFKLTYTYLMTEITIEEELLSPGLKDKLISLGLQKTELSPEEFALVLDYEQKYLQLSLHDRIALSIAKLRTIPLLTGDGALRKAATKEGVKLMGTLKILDELHQAEIIQTKEYEKLLKCLEAWNGKKVRLPKVEIEKRLNSLKQQK